MPADRTSEPSSPSNVADDPLSARSKANRKRRTPGACDFCKKKKVRCDSAEMPGNKCSNCIAASIDCTHDEVLKNLRNMREYVEVLEGRLKKMDQLLNKAIPGIDLTTLGTDPISEETGNKDAQSPIARNDDDLDNLTTRIVSLQLNPKQNYFLGKSSGHQLFQTALEVKDEYIGLWNTKQWWTCKRPIFWEVPSWMVPHPEAEEEPPLYIFPEIDLLISLVDAYFTNMNPFLPLLHRPTFEKSLANKEHFKDHMFGGTVMLVCALGSRYSNDPRVFTDGSGATTSAGWKWYCQVNVVRRSFFKRTSLYELQMYALSVSYIHSTQAPDGVWTQIGTGLRLAQEVGAHRRRKTPDGRPTAENELWKRAFWVLVVLDRLISSYSGRPCGLQEEDFDLDLPVDCDDEYWDNGFIQPLGKPSSISFFISYIKLLDILAYAIRVIYPIRRPKSLLGKAVHLAEQEVIAELDSAMNSWMDSVPNHLRWNPTCASELLMKQAAGLHAAYYDLQILIHRPFIPSPRNPQQGAFPSLAICTNAARLCCHVLENFNKTNTLLMPLFQAPAVHSSIILLLNIWSGKKSGLASNPQRDMQDIQRCMKLLKVAEERWCSAGRYFDVITELACAGELPISATSPKPGSTGGDSNRNSTGTCAVRCHAPTPDSINSLSSSDESNNSSPHIRNHGTDFPLPVYTTDLGKLPIYAQYDFTDVNGMQNNYLDPFAVQVASDQNNATDFMNQFFPAEASVGIADSGAQNVFAAADFFVKNALFSGPSSYNNDIPYSSQTHGDGGSTIFGMHPEGFGEPSPFCSTGQTNSTVTEEITPTSVAASVFAAYDTNWDLWRPVSEHAKLKHGSRFFV